ncbi:MAG: hypothetical protein K1W34_05045 [Lachnospiraceae bacterium]
MENTQTQQTEGQQTQNQQTGGQQEKLFTQADVDRIVGNRLARLKQDMEATDTYRQERDEARRELEEYKNNAFLKEKGVKEEDIDYIAFKASKMIDDKTDFKQAVEIFLKENPRFTGRGFRVVSTGTPNGGHGSNGAEDAEIRKAMGLKG